jgi:hypothetical protein
MEHPLIPSLDSLTAEELLTKINELNRKLGIAYNTGNAHLCDQIRMALDSYTTKQQEKTAELYKPKGGEDAFDSKIDIS